MSLNVFSESEQRSLLDEDHQAWLAVCGILMTIVSLGVCIAAFAVLIITF